MEKGRANSEIQNNIFGFRFERIFAFPQSPNSAILASGEHEKVGAHPTPGRSRNDPPLMISAMVGHRKRAIFSHQYPLKTLDFGPAESADFIFLIGRPARPRGPSVTPIEDISLKPSNAGS
jgi:hypothetical protein